MDNPPAEHAERDARDPETLASLTDQLERYAATLPEREQRTLLLLLLAALDPVDRMRVLAPPELFSAREEAFLRTLGECYEEAPPWDTSG